MTPGHRSAACVGVRLRRWAERHCSQEVLDALILPVVADLQDEEAVSQGNALLRWSSRVRNYAGLAKALGLHLAIYGRFRMSDSTPSPRLTALDLARMALMLPLVLVGLASAGYLCQAGLADILYLNGAPGYRVVWAWNLANSWPGNVVSGALLAAMFVAAILWVAPPDHRVHLLCTPPPRAVRVGLYAIGALWIVVGIAWGGHWALSDLPYWPHITFRPLVMGLAVWLGGMTPFWLARRAYRARPSGSQEIRSGQGTHAERQATASDVARLGIMVPGALLAAAAAEVLMVKYVRTALHVSGYQNWENALYASAFWIASPLMAAAFVAVLCAVAPPARRGAVAIAAAGTVVLWGALLVFGSLHPWAGQPGFAGWPLAMGPVTWLCGAGALWLVRGHKPVHSSQ